MEGVGARLGRSSTRYGPATVFSGPVRKWKKKWMHVSASSNASVNHTPSSNGTNGNNGSHLLLYKWTPTTQSNNNGDKGSMKDDTPVVTPEEEPPRKKFRYVPDMQGGHIYGLVNHEKRSQGVEIEHFLYVTFSDMLVAVIEEQKREAEEKADEEEAKPSKADPSTGGTSKSDGSDGKPDINDVPVEETQAMDEDQSTPQELNETSLDLNLGLKAHDADRESSSKPEDPNKVQLERVSSGGVGTSR